MVGRVTNPAQKAAGVEMAGWCGEFEIGVLDILIFWAPWWDGFFFSRALVKQHTHIFSDVSHTCTSMRGLLRKLLMAICLLFQAIMVAGRRGGRGGGGFLSTAGSYVLSSGGANQAAGR